MCECILTAILNSLRFYTCLARFLDNATFMDFYTSLVLGENWGMILIIR